MDRRKAEKGIITLEASIVLTLFICLMLFLYGLIVLFLAYDSIGHALLQTANSLALDPMYSETMIFSNDNDAGVDSLGELVSEVATEVFGLNGRGAFSSDTRWYYESDALDFLTSEEKKLYDKSMRSGEELTEEEKTELSEIEIDEEKKAEYDADVSLRNEQITAAAKTRFAGLFGNGDIRTCEHKLKTWGVENGFEGLDFSSSYVSGGKLNLIVRYKLSYFFNFFDLLSQDIVQSVSVKLWK